jgi:hypothetical protein
MFTVLCFYLSPRASVYIPTKIFCSPKRKIHSNMNDEKHLHGPLVSIPDKKILITTASFQKLKKQEFFPCIENFVSSRYSMCALE